MEATTSGGTIVGIEKIYFDGEETHGHRSPLWSAAEAEELRQCMKDAGLWTHSCGALSHKRNQIDTILDELTAEEIQMLRNELAERDKWDMLLLH